MSQRNASIFVTGAAGFIGYHTCIALLKKGKKVVGYDNLNDYYDVKLKNFRLNELKINRNFVFIKGDIEDRKQLLSVFKKNRFEAVINLAARAGVRYSTVNPYVYLSTNAQGALNLLELCRQYKIDKFVQASTSSLYAGQKMPFKESLPVNTPISPYAASKKAAEAMCYSYHYLYGIDVSIVRYFTVYGPAGRPDMSIFRFIKWIDEGTPIKLFGDGRQSRDFTYVKDIAAGTIKALKKTGFKIINLGGNHSFKISYVIELLENNLGKKARCKYFPFHKADIKDTRADISVANKVLNWAPRVSLKDGINSTIAWYMENRQWIKKLHV